MIKINICKEFTDTPGARYIAEGPFSGEEFREKLLIPRYEKAKSEGEKLQIDLDGSFGYPTSFLEEAFGGLSRIYGAKEVLDIVRFISDDEPAIINDIESYIKQANEGK